MEGPGMSLFQGAASIHINNSAQDRLEEQEELEDQKRRNEELKHKLANAFDDLLDDDEASSVNSSGNFTLDNAQTNGENNQHIKPGLPPAYVDSLNHLKDGQHRSESPRALCETPKNHLPRCPAQDESAKLIYTPYAGGDTQNHYFHQEFRGHVNGINNYEARQEYMNNEQLKVMYEMRVKECQQLAGQMEALETEVESLRARLAAATNDRDKAELSLQEAHHLLASSKHKLIEMEQQASALGSLAQKLAASEEEKEQLKMELMAANISLQEVQQRLHTLQVAHSHDTDTLFREQQDRHREEVDRLQNDLIKAKNRLEEKENEIKMLEKRCIERDREKESILIEKGTTINRLACELESAQNRLLAAETTRMKDKSKLESLAHELTTCRNKLSTTQQEFDTWRATLQQIMLESLPDNYLGEPSSPGKLTTLKDVLSRQRQQLHKLSALKQEIAKRDEKLEQQRKREEELLSQIKESKEKDMQLNSRITSLQNKVELLSSTSNSDLVDAYKEQNDKLQADLDEARTELKQLGLKHAELEMELDKARSSHTPDNNAELMRQLERYSAQLKHTLRENGDLNNLYLQACSTRDAASRELKVIKETREKEKEQAKVQEAEYVERIQREKELVEKLQTELSNSREELERANKRISELQREFTDKQKQFTEKLDKYLEDEKSAMRNEMTNCLQCDKLLKQIPCLEEQISQCTLKLAAQESNEQLMKELKEKAEFFQRYIMERYRKLSGLRTVGTSTEQEPADAEPIERLDQDQLAVKNALMIQEKAIRDQIADKYTLEMKTMEMNYSRRIKEIESQNYQTIMTLKDLVESKAQQVDTLKDKLISEKTIALQMLDAKEKEISELIKEHNSLQKQLQTYKESTNNKLKHEIEVWKEKSNAKTLEYQAMKKQYSELKSLFRDMEQKWDYLQKELQTLLEKYHKCKKTVLTYKDYIAKKDEHINKEMKRIQNEYREIFVKLQTQLNHHVNCRMHEMRQRGSDIHEQATIFPQYDYSERMKKLSEEFSKITQFRQPETEQG